MVNEENSQSEKREQIRREMLDHLQRFGLQRARLVAVAEGLGMSHANIYRFFKNKEEIVDSIAMGWLREADELIAASDNESALAAERLIILLTALNAHLHRKLAEETAAEEIFGHVFNRRPDELAEHLTVLKMRIGDLVAEHEAAFSAGDRVPAILDTMTVALSPFVNPLLMTGRSAAEDRPRIETLVNGLLSR